MLADIGGTSVKVYRSEVPKELKDYVFGYDGEVAILPVVKEVFDAIGGPELIAAAPGRVEKLQEGLFKVFSRKREILKGLELKAKLVVNDCIAFSFFVAEKAGKKGYRRVTAVVLGSGANAHSFVVEELFKRKNLWKQPEGGFMPLKASGRILPAQRLVSKQFFDALGVDPRKASKAAREKFQENVARWLSMLILPFVPEAVYIGGGIARLLKRKVLKEKLLGFLPEIFPHPPEIFIVRQRDANLRGLKVISNLYK